MEQYHGTTIVSVRRDGLVAIGGDGQVSMGNTVMKGNARKVRRLFRDKVIAGFAGALGGFVPLFQKVSTTPLGLSRPLLHLQFGSDTALTSLVQRAVNLMSNPWALTWIAISLVSMAVMQFAYRRGRAIQLIPAFAANTIAIPVVGGVIVFSERLHPVQWIGIILILAGVFLLTLETGHPVHPSKQNS